ncbi:MAG: ABC transporter substrate-binding protein [Thermodesulfobacteriota bacterium]
MNVKKVFVAAALLGIVFLINASVGQAKDVRGVTDKSVKIGVILDQTGPAAAITVPCTQAIRTYIRYINDNGGVHGRQLDVIVEDDRYSIPATLAAYKKLVFRDRIFSFIGPGSGGFVNILWRKIQQDKLPNVSVVFPDLAVNPLKRYIFTTSDTYEGQVRVLVDYIVKEYKLKNPRIALVYPDTETGKIDLRPALERLKGYNIEPVTKEVMMAGAIDASSQVMSLKKNNVNCVIHVGLITASAMTFLREMRKFGLETPAFHSWGAMLGEEIHTLGETAKQFYSVHALAPWYGEGSGVKSMRGITLKYHPGTEKPYRGTLYTHGWVLATVLVEGMKRAGKNLDAETLVDALETLKNFDTGGLCNPITYTSASHKGGDSWRIYRSDPVKQKYVPITEWRKSE